MAARSSSARLELIRFFEPSIVAPLSAAAHDGRSDSSSGTAAVISTHRCFCSAELIRQATAQNPDRKLLMFCSAHSTHGAVSHRSQPRPTIGTQCVAGNPAGLIGSKECYHVGNVVRYCEGSGSHYRELERTTMGGSMSDGLVDVVECEFSHSEMVQIEQSAPDQADHSRDRRR